MKPFALAISICSIAASLVLATPAAAQTAENHLYAFAGPGKFSGDTTTFGAAGFEHIGRRGAGFGLELGGLAGIGPFRGDARAITTTSLTLLAVASDPAGAGTRVTPFFLAGVSSLENPATDTALAFMIGGGANVWLTRGLGIRVDLRVPIGWTRQGGGAAGLGLTLR